MRPLSRFFALAPATLVSRSAPPRFWHFALSLRHLHQGFPACCSLYFTHPPVLLIQNQRIHANTIKRYFRSLLTKPPLEAGFAYNYRAHATRCTRMNRCVMCTRTRTASFAYSFVLPTFPGCPALRFRRACFGPRNTRNGGIFGFVCRRLRGRGAGLVSARLDHFAFSN